MLEYLNICIYYIHKVVHNIYIHIVYSGNNLEKVKPKQNPSHARKHFWRGAGAHRLRLPKYTLVLHGIYSYSLGKDTLNTTKS